MGRSPAATENGLPFATTEAVATSSATRGPVTTSLPDSVAAGANADSSATGSFPSARASATRRVGTTPTVHINSAPASEKTKVRARKTRTTVAPTTSRTVMGGGNAATWPAARPFPPSLAGAYSTNLKTAFVTLVKYSDWLGSHPNPNFVRNYVATTSNIYEAQLILMRDLVARGWHEAPNPTEVDLIKIVKAAALRMTVKGRPLMTAGRRTYSSGIIDVVINQKREPYLNRGGEVVGETSGGGPTPWTVSLIQSSSTGAFRIGAYREVKISGGIAKWEKKAEERL